MDFPEEKDINRLISCKDYDFGFFILAIFSFIETYMKNKVINATNNPYYNEFKFKYLLQDYLYYVHNISDYYSVFRSRDSFYSNLLTYKGESDDVRHNFSTKHFEEVMTSIRLLLRFFEENDKSIRKQLTPFNELLKEWEKRQPPLDAKSFEEAISCLGLLGDKVSQIVLEAEEYEELKNKVEKLEASRIQLEQQVNKNESTEEEYKRIIADLRNKEQELQEKYSNNIRYIEYQQQLISYSRTRTEFEQSIRKLTQEQLEAVDRIRFTADYLIKGSAGTGKSLVLLKTIEKLLGLQNTNEKLLDNKDSIYFLTYTNSLVNYNKYIASLLQMGIKPEKIITADVFFNRILATVNGFKSIDYSSNQYNSVIGKIKKIISNRYSSEGISAEDVYTEVTKFIWPNAITRKEYLDDQVSRKGMNKRLSIQQREKYWNIIYELHSLLKADKKWLIEYATYNTALKLKDMPLTDNQKLAEYVFVDESQDLSVAALICIKSVTKKSIVMARDIDQTINQIPLNYSNGGLNVVGNSLTLHTNFRNTIQINDVADKYRKLIPGASTYSNSAFKLGVPVELVDLSTENNKNTDLNKLVLSKIHFLINELNYVLENICIIFSESSTARIDSMISYLEKNKLPAENIKNKDFETSNKISISTIQSCKGLDFSCVILIADNFSSFEFKSYDEDIADKIQRNKLYVACTRALDSLTVITGRDCKNGAIQSLKECILECNNSKK